ncbi:MAG: ubiquitin-like small modifier protein 1 [Thermoplasmatota archaeon]
MSIRVKFFASLREDIGKDEVKVKNGNLKDVGEVLKELLSNNKKLHDRLFEDEFTLNDNIIILKDGRNIEYLDGLSTEVKEGDSIAVFPLVAGG